MKNVKIYYQLVKFVVIIISLFHRVLILVLLSLFTGICNSISNFKLFLALQIFISNFKSTQKMRQIKELNSLATCWLRYRIKS